MRHTNWNTHSSDSLRKFVPTQKSATQLWLIPYRLDARSVVLDHTIYVVLLLFVLRSPLLLRITISVCLSVYHSLTGLREHNKCNRTLVVHPVMFFRHRLIVFTSLALLLIYSVSLLTMELCQFYAIWLSFLPICTLSLACSECLKTWQVKTWWTYFGKNFPLVSISLLILLSQFFSSFLYISIHNRF